ncbi:hypothetical protein [Leucobacter luti]|uniref:Uncharacterized protein n=1 Tax=Leucobacter luti TaxID=340320 RepID=A0A4Q7U5D3_9MICO|nr:hypothetical protein [Leucobacter luti]MBL3700954.1 hypothetical protein [Leucobacter luti]RZT68824.1 hypothetical protein EV139_0553 [Leucobacter luti]
MDLKFTFGGASPDHHDHGDAPSGVSLPLTAKPVSLGPTSSVLEITARRADSGIVAEAVSGDGVTYARAEVALPAGPGADGADAADTDSADAGAQTAAAAKAVRSAISRVIAGLDGPLADGVTGLVLDLGADAAEVLTALGIDPAAPVVDAALQRRAGIAMGTPVRIAA